VSGPANADVLVTITNGTAGPPVNVQPGQGYISIAARPATTGFIAIAPATANTTQDTVG